MAGTSAAPPIGPSDRLAGSVETVVLIEPEDIDAISAKAIDYLPPGG